MKSTLGILILLACMTVFAVGSHSNGAETTKTDYAVSNSESAPVVLSEAYAVNLVDLTVDEFAANCICKIAELPAGSDVFVADNKDNFYNLYGSGHDKPTHTNVGERFKPPQVLRL